MPLPKSAPATPEFDSDAKRERWDELVKAGQSDTGTEEYIRWRHGDRAAEVSTLWSSDAPLIAYGTEIGLASPARIYEFHRTSVTFPPATRELIHEDLMGITWSHCNVAAARAKKIAADASTAFAWLIRAHDNNWNVDTFRKQLKNIDADFVEHRSYINGEIETLRVPDDEKGAGYVTVKIKAAKVDSVRQLMTQKDFVADLRLTYKLPVLKDEKDKT